MHVVIEYFFHIVRLKQWMTAYLNKYPRTHLVNLREGSSSALKQTHGSCHYHAHKGNFFQATWIAAWVACSTYGYSDSSHTSQFSSLPKWFEVMIIAAVKLYELFWITENSTTSQSISFDLLRKCLAYLRDDVRHYVLTNIKKFSALGTILRKKH